MIYGTRLPFLLIFLFSFSRCQKLMQVNTEQVNTQKMLEHNRMKERSVQGSLQRKMVNVVEGNIDYQESTILNCEDYSKSKLDDLLSTGSVRSDADAQILVKIKFREKVDCSQITFNPSSSDKPRIIKLYANKNEIDFGDVEAIAPSAVIEIPFENESSPLTVSLAGSKFTRIQSLQIYVEDNYGTDQTCLGPLRIDGFISPSYHTH